MTTAAGSLSYQCTSCFRRRAGLCTVSSFCSLASASSAAAIEDTVLPPKISNNTSCIRRRKLFFSSSTSASSNNSSSDEVTDLNDVVDEEYIEQHGQYMGVLEEKRVPLVWFSSRQGKNVLARSIKKGAAESYFPLSEQFVTQSTPPSCGPATLSMVLNSLRIDPGRVWKKPWRWFTEEMLVSCFGRSQSELENPLIGTTMEHFALLAECNGSTAQTFYADMSSLDLFRMVVQHVTATEKQRLVVCFSRPDLGQTGSGHYSPIAAYDEESDMVLVLDVARFKYPPYWVSCNDLFNAMTPVDCSTGRSRGFFVLSSLDDEDLLCSQFQTKNDPVSNSIQGNDFGISKDIIQKLVKKALVEASDFKTRGLAAEFVHSIRVKRLKDNDSSNVVSKQIDDIRKTKLHAFVCELFRGSNISCDKALSCSMNNNKISICFKDLLYMCPRGGCISSLLSVSLRRPIDFFLRSVPQEVSELAALFIIEKGSSIFPLEVHKHLVSLSLINPSSLSVGGEF